MALIGNQKLPENKMWEKIRGTIHRAIWTIRSATSRWRKVKSRFAPTSNIRRLRKTLVWCLMCNHRLKSSSHLATTNAIPSNISQLQWTNVVFSALPRDSLVALLCYHSFILLLQDLLPSFIFRVCQCIIQTFLMTNYKIISPLPKSWISKNFISSNDASYKITLHSSMNRLPGARNFFQYHLYFGMPRSSQGFILPL